MPAQILGAFVAGLLIFVSLQRAFALQNSESSDRVNTAMRIITTFCLAGGRSTTFVSESVASPSGGMFHFKSDSGSFVIHSTEAEGLVNGIQSEMSALTADQANRARDCMSPFISQVIAIAFGEFNEKTNRIVQEPNQIVSSRYFHDVSVHYYLKAADGIRVTNALKRRGISFTQIASILPETLHSNAVYCGPNARRCDQRTRVNARRKWNPNSIYCACPQRRNSEDRVRGVPFRWTRARG